MAWSDDHSWNVFSFAKSVQGCKHYPHRSDADLSRSDWTLVRPWRDSFWLCIGVRRTVDLLRRCRNPVPFNNSLILSVEEEVDQDLFRFRKKYEFWIGLATRRLGISSGPRIPGPLRLGRGSGTLVGSRPRL